MSDLRTRAAADTSFPRWVAIASLALVLWLYFANTVPAAHERTELQGVLADLRGLRSQFDAAIAERRLGLGNDRSLDMQSLLIAIDQHNLTPAELWAAHPQPADDEQDPAAIAARKFR